MDLLKASYFFDLSTYAHASLFESHFVWMALPRIKEYLKSQPLGKIEADIPHGTFVIDPHLVSIGRDTIIEPGAYIKGPCVIGEKCVIRHGAYIRGDLITGDRCVIGHDTEIKNSILLNDAHAAHFAYLGDSILGNRTNLGAGTKCANLKFKSGPIIVHFQGKRFETGLRKFGAIIGDDAQIGCNAVTNPGTLLGKNVIWHPCLNYGGFIPSNSIVKNTLQVRVVQV